MNSRRELPASRVLQAQFRREMFNMTNRPNWGAPNHSLGGSSFGVITPASSRRILQAGLKLYW